MFNVHAESILPWTHHLKWRYQLRACKSEQNQHVAQPWEDDLNSSWDYAITIAIWFWPSRTSVSRSSIVEWTPELNFSVEKHKQQLLEPQIVKMPDSLRYWSWKQIEVASPLSRNSNRILTTQDSNPQSESFVDYSKVRSVTMLHTSWKCMQWFVEYKNSECCCSAKNFGYTLLILHSAIYFEGIYHRRLGLNDISCDSQGILFGFNVKEDKTKSAQTCYQNFQSLRQRRVVPTYYQMQRWNSISKPLKPCAANLTGQTSYS